jgi:uncharacterized protein YcfJ
MKILSKLLVSTLACGLLPAVQAAEFADYGRVVRVEPRTEQVRQPREECRTDYVQAPVQPPSQRTPGGAIVGGIAGALLGNQVGSGSGRAAATAAGAVAGAVVGDRIDNRRHDQGQYPAQTQEQAVRQCRMVEAYEPRTVGYDVTYDYRGQIYTTLMPEDPGKRVRLRVSVEPDRRQY